MSRTLDNPGALQRLLADRRGAVALLGVLGVTLVLAVGTMAFDMARIQLMTGRLQSAADAATLAAARETANGAAAGEAIARTVFDANLAGRLAGGQLTAFTAREVSDVAAGDRGYRIEATVQAPLALAGIERFFGRSGLTHATLTTASEALQRTRGAEVVMVLDNTGSMAGQKIRDLRTATSALIDALFGDQQSVPNLAVAIVPYSASVNIGTQHAAWIDPAAGPLGPLYQPTQWKGCVMARSAAAAETDAPPAPGALFRPHFWPSSAFCGRNDDDGDDGDGDDGDSDGGDDETAAPDRTTDARFKCDFIEQLDPFHASSPNVWPQYKADGTGYVDERLAAGNSGFGPNLGCVAPIVPLTASRKKIEDAVPMLEAWSRGGTMANLGLAWGWRVMSPRWNGLWLTPGGAVNAHEARPYDSPVSMKIMILMTDGENLWHQKDYTTFGRQGEMIQPKDIDPGMLRMCTSLKNEGVLLFTITFGASISAKVMSTYAQCASSTLGEQRISGPKYFHAPTGALLKTVFSDIAGRISDLRLVR